MKNLILSLSSHRLKLHASEAELKDLLTTVKEQRAHDTKVVDAFYDSLEGVMLDLRTVTIDSRDAEPFLKPVSKTDYPDYYEIIANPMDFQTMMKKVKQRHYKSKREFQDDLELIWTNCYSYNVGDTHPLRLAVNRLRAKSEVLLRNVTDRKDRLDPPVHNLTIKQLPAKLNGMNGHATQYSSPPSIKSSTKSPPAVKVKRETPTSMKPAPRELPFRERPAFVRSTSGMSVFMRLDATLERGDPGPSTLAYAAYGRPSAPSIADQLRQFAGEGDDESDDEGRDFDMLNGAAGDKRKLAVNGSFRPRKRARRDRQEDGPQDLAQLWWKAVQSDALMANAVPCTRSSISEPPQIGSPAPPIQPIAKKPGKRKIRKKVLPEQEPKTLLHLINDNIRTMKRVRRTHDKFLALNLGGEEGGDKSAPLDLPEPVEEEDDIDVAVDERPWRPKVPGAEVGEQEADGCLQWMGTKILEHAGFQGTSKAALDVFTGVAAEYLFNVGRTVRFLCDKYSRTMTAEELILHTLFESGITHIRDLERYINDDVMRYGGRLVDLEKKLVGAYHDVTAVEAMDDDAFFGNEEEEDEEGELVMGNFADSFGEDFLGLRELGIAADFGLSSLTVPKKLLKGKNKNLRNAQDNKPKEPPPPYPPPPPFIPLDSSKVEDQIGLLKSFYTQKLNSITTHAASVPPTAPVNLSQPVFMAPPSHPHLPPGPTYMGTMPMFYHMGIPSSTVASNSPYSPAQSARSPIVIPDDSPNPSHTKIGPLGQILKPNTSSSKKKAKGKEGPSHMPAPVPHAHAGVPNGMPIHAQSGSMMQLGRMGANVGGNMGDESPTKKKKSSAGKKKEKAKSSEPMPPVIVASA